MAVSKMMQQPIKVLIHAEGTCKDSFSGRNLSGFWSPASEAKGIPGTEEAVINISRELARNSEVEVTVVARCGDQSGVYDGVQWISLNDFVGLIGKEQFNHAFFLGHEAAVESVRLGFKADQTYLWLENNYPEPLILPFVGVVYDKIMPLTPWSRSLYPNVPESRIFLTRNGVHLAYTDAVSHLPRQAHRLAYGSDYDRGLVTLLLAWPEVKRHFPNAELDIFYGWEIFDKKMSLIVNPQERQQWLGFKEQTSRLMQQPGIHHHGRVGHQEVARFFAQADIWPYPCTFPESSCITAMKAQILGAIPVVIPTGALRDTVKFGYKTSKSSLDWHQLHDRDSTLQEWFHLLIHAMSNPPHTDDLRCSMKEQCRHYFSWKTIAAEWLDKILMFETQRDRSDKIQLCEMMIF